MAVIPTGAIYKTLNFDGQSSGTYGVYITGDAVFNAPERDVEMVKIPGRNGAFALDNGRFENIEVTYPAGIFAETEADFAAAISDFRNYLCSRKGYCRLTDDYNPDEYRLGIYKSGLEVEPALLKAGEFNITFECKPQRYLTTGENPITVTDGDTLTNPTLFESSPLIEAKGEGVIIINGFEIFLEDAEMGLINLKESDYACFSYNDEDVFDPTDTINVELDKPAVMFSSRYAQSTVEIVSVTKDSGDLGLTPSIITNEMGGRTTYSVLFTPSSPLSFTANQVISWEDKFTVRTKRVYNGQSPVYTNYKLNITAEVTNPSPDMRFDLKYSLDSGSPTDSYINLGWNPWIMPQIKSASGYSTLSVLGDPTYIDCDLGEAYKYNDNDEIISLNAYIDLGSQLPVLAPGSNDIECDYSITSLKIQPRWWKI